MRFLALCLLLAAACQERAVPPAPPASQTVPPVAVRAASPNSSDAASGAWTAAQLACVDEWLQAHTLDAYGNPQGTMYMGGTPLFDEATGQHLPRQAFLATRRPDALRACGL